MRLASYLEEKGLDQIEAARALGCSKSYLSRLCNGLAEPSLRFARKVADWSAGAVSLDDWPEPARVNEAA
jgi:transcriptional regulator with XRE-family HTH domain